MERYHPSPIGIKVKLYSLEHSVIAGKASFKCVWESHCYGSKFLEKVFGVMSRYSLLVTLAAEANVEFGLFHFLPCAAERKYQSTS